MSQDSAPYNTFAERLKQLIDELPALDEPARSQAIADFVAVEAGDVAQCAREQHLINLALPPLIEDCIGYAGIYLAMARAKIAAQASSQA